MPPTANPLDFHSVALFADVEAFCWAELIAAAGAFVDVAAEKIGGFGALDPGAQRGTAAMFAGCEFVELGALRREMDHEIELRNGVEACEGFRDIVFGVFAGRVERRDVAVAEAGPLRYSCWRRERAELAMKIDEAEAVAEGARVVVRFVISRQDPNTVAERFEQFAAAIEAFAERREISGGDIDVGGLAAIFSRARRSP